MTSRKIPDRLFNGQDRMTIRDEFAVRAMGLFEWETNKHETALRCYWIADAMMLAREDDSISRAALIEATRE